MASYGGPLRSGRRSCLPPEKQPDAGISNWVAGLVNFLPHLDDCCDRSPFVSVLMSRFSPRLARARTPLNWSLLGAQQEAPFLNAGWVENFLLVVRVGYDKTIEKGDL